MLPLSGEDISKL